MSKRVGVKKGGGERLGRDGDRISRKQKGCDVEEH